MASRTLEIKIFYVDSLCTKQKPARSRYTVYARLFPSCANIFSVVPYSNANLWPNIFVELVRGVTKKKQNCIYHILGLMPIGSPLVHHARQLPSSIVLQVKPFRSFVSSFFVTEC